MRSGFMQLGSMRSGLCWLVQRHRPPRLFSLASAAIVLSSFGGVVAIQALLRVPVQAQAPTEEGGPITMRADIQEANSNTGIITARGNVRIDYPGRQIYATSAQAQYYSRERRIVLNGNVLIQQEGNTIKAETVTYLVDEGRFVATPDTNSQVESVYILPASSEPATSETAPNDLPPLPEAAVPADLPDTAVPLGE